MQKTNAMRILDKANLEYNTIIYENKDGKIDGVSIAKKIGKRCYEVFKTLVTVSNSKNIYVFIIPVNEEIDFKKAAKVSGEKNIEMINVNDMLKITGYIRGGCSPIGMRKQYKTFIHKSCTEIETIVFSGGKIGIQIEINLENLKKVINLSCEDIIK
ncbi:MAG: Cys-tRNA(Pro) deacylase [Clostridium sp.]